MMSVKTDEEAPPFQAVDSPIKSFAIAIAGFMMMVMVLMMTQLMPAGHIGGFNLPAFLNAKLAEIIKSQPTLPGLAAKSPRNSGVTGRVTGVSLLASGMVTVTTGVHCDPAADLRSGQVYYPALYFLNEMNKAGFSIRLSCVHSGHLNPSNPSLHDLWQAFDVDMVDNQPICASQDTAGWCTDMPTPARKLMTWIRSLPNSQLPFEIGGPHFFPPGSRGKIAGPGYTRGGPFFTQLDHETHLHFGFKPWDKYAPAGGWLHVPDY